MSEGSKVPSEDTEKDENCPTTWQDGRGVSDISLSYTSPGVVDPIQYGPLTAWGNFFSQNDPTTSADQLHGFTNNLADTNFDAGSRSGQVDPEQWLATSVPPLIDGSNTLYSEFLHTPYRTAALSDAASMDADASLMPAYPGGSFLSRTYSPYDGIWAFNPMAVDDNFVYPPSMPQPPPVTTEAPISTDQTDSHSTIAPSLREMAVSFAATSTIISTAFPASVPLDTSTPYVTTHTHTNPPGIASDLSEVNNAQPVTAAKSSRPEKVKRNRAGQAQSVVPRRQGPLSMAQRQKADDMRYYGACWRCRRYKKPCNGPGTCDTCLTSGFRVWPSTIGCYRGNMEDFIVGVMPGNAEQVINGMDFNFKKVPNWKTLFGYQPDMAPIPYNTGSKDKYEALSIKLQATRMAGKGFVELLDILANYQRSRTKPDTCLELVCSALNHICDIYHAFVETDTPIRLDSQELLSALTRFRTAYSDNWRHFLQLCLSGRRPAWFPAFLCACINCPLLVVVKDGFVAIPEPARTTLWPNISFLIEDLRNRLYPMGLDLLSALAKGIKPWKLRCWGWKERLEEDGSITMERDPDGMRLLAGDIGAFDGFAAVQSWLARHRVDMLDGVSFLTTPPFSERNAKMQPVATLAWIFEVNPPADRESAFQNGQIIAGAA